MTRDAPEQPSVPEIFPRSPHKTYGLMALVRGTTPAIQPEPERGVSTWPHLLLRGLVCALACLSVLLVFSLLRNAPLAEPASPAETPNPTKAPWQFLGLQELLHYSAFLGGVLMPGLTFLGLVLLPYLDRSRARLARDRRLGICLFTLFLLGNVVLIVIGAYFRGPDWSFVVPWKAGPAGGHP